MNEFADCITRLRETGTLSAVIEECRRDRCDWRNHTCGECGYYRGGSNYGYCRRVTWGWIEDVLEGDAGSHIGDVEYSAPACPDCKLREADK